MTEAVDLSRAAIADRPRQLSEGLWLHRECSLRRLAWVDGEWVAYDSRGGEYRQSLFPDGLAASLYQPLGIDNDPRLSERVPWPAACRAVPPAVLPFEFFGFLIIAALGLAAAVNVGYHAPNRQLPTAAQLRAVNEDFIFVLGAVGAVISVALAAWLGALRVRERRRRTRRQGSGVPG